MIKLKYTIAIVGLLLTSYGVVSAAPNFRLERHLFPETSNTYDLGTTTKKWKSVNATTYYGDGSNLTGISGGGTPGGSDTQVQFNDGGSFGGDAGFTYNKTTDVATLGGLVTATITAPTSAGGILKTNSGADVLHWGNGGSANATAYGGWNFDGATANTIASFGASKTLTSLSTTTYPSLTELSYVKGVTSAIQTQIDSKLNTANPVFTGVITGGLGTAALPSYSFTGDTNTGMWSPGADSIAWSHGGSEYMRLTSGRLGIGTTGPSQLLHIRGAAARMRIEATSGDPVIEMTSTTGNSFLFARARQWHIRTDSPSHHVKLQVGDSFGTQGLVQIGNGSGADPNPTSQLTVRNNVNSSTVGVLDVQNYLGTSLFFVRQDGVSALTGSLTVSSPGTTTTSVLTTDGTQTVTNKRIQPRSSTAASGDITPALATASVWQRTALSAGITINAPTGTPVLGESLVFILLDNGTSRSLTWNATFTTDVMGAALPTATTANKKLIVTAIYDGTNWLSTYVEEI